MLPSELIKQVRLIEIKTRRNVDEIFGGAYHSVFKGRGMEFDEVREYIEGDDIRDIDWNVTARMNIPYIKKFVEERELTVMLLVDVSASGAFGSGDRTKRRQAVETAALLAFSAIRNHDRVGLMLFSDQTELYLPPRSGRTHSLRLIRELLACEPKDRGTNIDAALRETMNLLHKKSVIFLISDFIDAGEYDKSLKICSRRHDLRAVRILDPVEWDWLKSCDITLEDSETGEDVTFAGGSKRFATAYHDVAAEMHDTPKKLCRQAGVKFVDLPLEEDFVKVLAAAL